MEKLKVFYNAHQSTDDNDSFSPSASKSRAFIEYIDLNRVELVSGFAPPLSG